MVNSGGRRGGSGQKKATRSVGHTIRSGASRGALPRVIFNLLIALEEGLPDTPDQRRIVLRNMRSQLTSAYPALRLTESDVAQCNAEEDEYEIPPEI